MKAKRVDSQAVNTFRACNPGETVIHQFQAAGLGTAPFNFIRIVVTHSQCEYCSTPLVYQFWLQGSGANDRPFFVGSDCVLKTGDAGLKKIVERELAARHSQRAADLADLKVEAVKKAILEPRVVAALQSQAHPFSSGWYKYKELTYLDYAKQQTEKSVVAWRRRDCAKVYAKLVADKLIEKLPRFNARKEQEEQSEE